MVLNMAPIAMSLVVMDLGVGKQTGWSVRSPGLILNDV